MLKQTFLLTLQLVLNKLHKLLESSVTNTPSVLNYID